ncbi:GIY-YIG nuclease family protein [Streptomyces sp. NPDC056817]|uniref:GIY-YIG nuclease family protein n=1 Tax=Streptomyces sp. NPDC056817 TaxID=3345950 RepID=UPI0036C20C67
MPKSLNPDLSGSIVYVIGEPDSNTVKIGVTVSFERRLAEIQRMSPVRLVERWSHPGGKELERHLHSHFRPLRSHGEWFTFPADPIPLIAKAVDEHLRVRVSGSFTDDVLRVLSRDVHAEMERIESIANPAERLKAIDQLDELRLQWARRHRQEIARGLHDQGLAWKKVGKIMGGVSHQRAHQYAYGTAKDRQIIMR